jgi:hypothetical protein
MVFPPARAELNLVHVLKKSDGEDRLQKQHAHLLIREDDSIGLNRDNMLVMISMVKHQVVVKGSEAVDLSSC